MAHVTRSCGLLESFTRFFLNAVLIKLMLIHIVETQDIYK